MAFLDANATWIGSHFFASSFGTMVFAIWEHFDMIFSRFDFGLWCGFLRAGPIFCGLGFGCLV